MDEYPKRPKFFAEKVTRLLCETGAAQEMGPTATLLVIFVAATEDATRYRRPVTFHNDQLTRAIGLKYWRSFAKARKAAIDAGWLHYRPPPPGSRKPGYYWVCVPADVVGPDDSLADEPTEPSPQCGHGGMPHTPEAWAQKHYGQGDRTPEAWAQKHYGRAEPPDLYLKKNIVVVVVSGSARKDDDNDDDDDLSTEEKTLVPAERVMQLYLGARQILSPQGEATSRALAGLLLRAVAVAVAMEDPDWLMASVKATRRSQASPSKMDRYLSRVLCGSLWERLTGSEPAGPEELAKARSHLRQVLRAVELPPAERLKAIAEELHSQEADDGTEARPAYHD